MSILFLVLGTFIFFILFQSYMDDLVKDTVKLCQEVSDVRSHSHFVVITDKEVAIRQHRSRLAALRVDDQVQLDTDHDD